MKTKQLKRKIKIAFFDTKPYDQKFFETFLNNEKYKNHKKYSFTVNFFQSHLNKNTVKLAKDFDVVCAFVNDTLDQPVLKILKSFNIKLIIMRCAGYNNVDIKYAYQNIHITRVPAYSPYAVAEHAVALMMALNRKIYRAYNRTRDINFSLNGLLGFDMHNKTAGIIGTGQIGKCLIKILNGFGMKILAYDKFPDYNFAKSNNVEYVELEKIYQKSDIISLHCPLTPESKYIINKDAIKKMKKNVMIINTSRGKLINTRDLIDALKNKKIGFAGLDVYEEESEYFFEDFSDSMIDDDILARLLTFSNVLVTSHQAFFTEEALSNITETSINNILDFYDGNELKNEICYQCEKKQNLCDKNKKTKCF